MREPRAYPLVVRIAMLSSDEQESLFGDFITADLDSVLASVCGGELSGIKSIIECESADEWARGAAIDSMVALVAAGLKSREEVVEYFGSLYREKLARTAENEILWAELICSTADLYPEELMGEIERAYQDDLVDLQTVRLEDVQRDLAKGKEQALAELAGSPHHRLIDDTVKEFGSWACFHGEESGGYEDDLDDDGYGEKDVNLLDERLESDEWMAAPSGTIQRVGAKTGRNDPCPCGSGRKFKRCCER